MRPAKIATTRLSLSAFLILALITFTHALEDASFIGKINADNINVRSDATVNSEVICKVNKGSSIEVISQFCDWYKIKLPRNAPTFIKNNFVTLIEDLPANSFDKLKGSLEQKRNAKVLKDNVNIRLGPDETSVILGKVNKNEVIAILEDKGGWYKIEPTNNSFGWINKKFVDKTSQKLESSIKASMDIKEAGTGTAVTQIEGIVKPYGVIIKRIATHKLITNDNSIFLLKGDKKTLNALNYHKVKVAGKITPAPNKQKYPIIEIEKIEELN